MDSLSDKLALRRFDLMASFAQSDAALEASVAGGRLMQSFAPINAALEYVHTCVHAVFGHDAVTTERRLHPRGMGLAGRADVEALITLDATCASTPGRRAVSELVEGQSSCDGPFPGDDVERGYRAFVASVASSLKPFFTQPVDRQPEPDPEPDAETDDELEGEEGVDFVIRDGKKYKPPPRPNPDPRRELSLTYMVPLASPWGITADVSVTLFPCVRGVSVPPCRHLFDTDDRRPDDYGVDEATDTASVGTRQGFAMKAAVLLLKCWKMDWHPSIRSHHITWAVREATRVIGVSFAHDSGTWRGRTLNIMLASLTKLEAAYRDVTQPTMFREDLKFDDAHMFHLADVLEGLQMRLREEVEPLFVSEAAL